MEGDLLVDALYYVCGSEVFEIGKGAGEEDSVTYWTFILFVDVRDRGERPVRR